MSKRSKKTPAPHLAPSRPYPGLAWIALSIALLIIIAMRMRLFDIPMDRDEGEQAYIGQLILQGVPPYSLAYMIKLPGTALMYAIFMALFGQTLQGVHLGLLIVNCASIVLVFLIGRRLFGDIAGIVAAISYAVLSLNHSVLGFAAHATHFVVLMALGGTLALLSAIERHSAVAYFAAGTFFGLAFVMKQPGLLFALFGVLYLIYSQNTRKPPVSAIQQLHHLASYIVGSVLPMCLIVLWCALSGSFDRLWFWTITYAREYGTIVPWSEVPSRFASSFADVVDGFALLWCLAAAGLAALAISPRLPEQRTFLLLFSACGFLAFCPGFYFRHHYFITFLPAAALAVGGLADLLWTGRSTTLQPSVFRFSGIFLFILAVGLGLYLERAYFFVTPPAALSRRFYSYNPFPESIEIAKFIRANSIDGDHIAVFGSEPQIYFLSGRRSATGHLCVYALMEDHPYSLAMQEEMVREVETARPRFIVFTSISGSWLSTPRSHRYISNWLSGYLKEHYSLEGVVDILTDSETVYQWRDKAKTYTFQTPRRVYILERTKDGKSS